MRIDTGDGDGLTGPARPRALIITALGITQILAWGSSYYLPAVLAGPVSRDTGWSLTWVVGGLSLGLLVAGLASPRIGRLIERRGGRPVLVTSALLLATGQLGLGLAESLPAYVASWVVLGLGMGTGLYDPAFATLGRLYGLDARRAITTLTLFGGFASTVCWPLSAFLVEQLGWRGACFVYAAIQLGISLPIYLAALPREKIRDVLPHDGTARAGADGTLPHGARRRLLIVLVGAALMLSAILSTTMSVHMLTVLQTRGVSLAEAVALGTLVGPSQVGARFLEMLIAHRHHAIWTKVASVSLVALGFVALASGLAILPFALILYGAGIGLESIARGTLPLALFGARGYATLMGKLALPGLVAQAAAPSAGAVLIEVAGSQGLLLVLLGIALANVAIVAVLVRATRRSL